MGKKKGGKKGKKKSGKKSAKSIKSAISDIEKEKELDPSSKEFWVRQENDLKSQVTTKQKALDLAEIDNNERVQRLQQLDEERTDIHQYLSTCLAERHAELQELMRRLFELQQAKDAERESFESQLKTLDQEYQETRDALGREQENLANKLASMREYEIQRADLMAKFARIEQALDDQLREHLAVIYDLERQMVVDKDRLRKEANERVSDLAAEFRKISDKQMEDTKKKALRENVTLNKNLQKYSDKTIALIEENDAYKVRAKQQEQLVEMLQFNEKELSRKFTRNVNHIRLQLDRAKGHEQRVEEYRGKSAEFQSVLDEHRGLLVDLERQKEEYDVALSHHAGLVDKLCEVGETSKKEKRTRQRLETVLLETAEAMEGCVAAQKDESQDESLRGQREMLINHLMRLLNTASSLGLGPPPAEFQVQRQGVYHTVTPTDHKGSGSGASKGKPAGYRGGLLGLVPGGQQQPGKSGSRLSTPASKLMNREGVLLRSVGSQTISIPQAMFLAKRQLTRPAAAARCPPHAAANKPNSFAQPLRYL